MSNKYDELFENLLKTIKYKDFDGSYMEGLDKSEFWREILGYMTSFNKKDLPLTAGSIGNETVFKEISERIDIDKKVNNFYDKIVSFIRENQDDSLWNESVSQIILEYLKKTDATINNEYEDFNPNKEINKTPIKIEHGSINVGGNIEKFKVSDIKNADAGFMFGNPWVRPQYNVDGETYASVRGDDKNIYALNNDEKLQYTREQKEGYSQLEISKWTRLLMPQYLRYVEVEDLNRNFWVISQVLTALCAYIFDDSSPYNLYGKITSELAQLWENVLYLWLLNALMDKQKFYEDIHYEIVFVPNDSTLSYRKFDNFDNIQNLDGEELWEEIDKRLEYLIADYPESNLCIVPVIRMGNYKHNYFSKCGYPGIWIYDRNQTEDKITHIKFSLKNISSYKSLNSNYSFPVIDISLDYYQDNLYGVKEVEEEYKYYYPLSSVPTEEAKKYYGLVRPKYELGGLDIAEDKETGRKYLNISNLIFRVSFNDLGNKIADQELKEEKVLDYSKEKETNQEDKYVILKMRHKESEGFSIEEIEDISEEERKYTNGKIEINKGYYQGEIPSYYRVLGEIDYDVDHATVSTFPIYINEYREDGFKQLYNKEQITDIENLQNEGVYKKLTRGEYAKYFGYTNFIYGLVILNTVKINGKKFDFENCLENYAEYYNEWLSKLNDYIQINDEGEEENIKIDEEINNLLYFCEGKYRKEINLFFNGYDIDDINIQIGEEDLKKVFCQVCLFSQYSKIINPESYLNASLGFDSEGLKNLSDYDRELREGACEVGAAAVQNKNKIIFRTVGRAEGDQNVLILAKFYISDPKLGTKSKGRLATVISQYPYGNRINGATMKIMERYQHYDDFSYKSYFHSDNEAYSPPSGVGVFLQKQQDGKEKYGLDVVGSINLPNFFWMKEKGSEKITPNNFCLVFNWGSIRGGMFPGCDLIDKNMEQELNSYEWRNIDNICTSIYNRDGIGALVRKDDIENIFKDSQNKEWSTLVSNEKIREFINNLNTEDFLEKEKAEEIKKRLIYEISYQAKYLDQLKKDYIQFRNEKESWSDEQKNTSENREKEKIFEELLKYSYSFSGGDIIFLPCSARVVEQTSTTLFFPDGSMIEEIYIRKYKDNGSGEWITDGDYKWEQCYSNINHGSINSLITERENYEFVNIKSTTIPTELYKSSRACPPIYCPMKENKFNHPNDENYITLRDKYYGDWKYFAKEEVSQDE